MTTKEVQSINSTPLRPLRKFSGLCENLGVFAINEKKLKQSYKRYPIKLTNPPYSSTKIQKPKIFILKIVKKIWFVLLFFELKSSILQSQIFSFQI